MKEIFVYNNLTRKKEKLIPINPPTLNIYTCGPTVYDDSHIGHARSAVTWDFITRFLRYSGYKVNWARNITDIDDKIINKSKELNTLPNKVARKYLYSFYEDMNALGVEWPDYEPQATQYLPQMFSFIDELLKKEFAYIVDNDIYFSVTTFKDYGKLKGQNISDLEKGYGRIELNEKKRNNLDFALWKSVAENEYGFDSQWGKGKPGWHLECSTMNFCLFGTKLDIHGGGDDLIFPHHENEIAQSEAYTGKLFAKYWLHNGMILINEKKMAKSEGNYITIKDSLKNTTSNTIRLFILNSHYKMPLNYTSEAITAAENGVKRLGEALTDTEYTNGKLNSLNNIDENIINDFNQAMNNDFNSPQALSVLFNIADMINIEKNKTHKTKYQSTLLLLTNILGFNFLSPDYNNYFLKEKSFNKIIELLINWRNESRIVKDFKISDKIRDLLNDCNIQVKDLKDGKFKWQFKI